ncbi:RES family NAD+ phosphorylase [Rhodococcus fascians]|nr:RES family NAD+ phosphorylase [Rhodococcus fascians]MBY4137677.1 RES family NAD+ phosphorylase [Rhodococcus fascians]MBY4215596.1 RES family NAD+ phosphorylase [Rhodococcus fascians]MBY4222621.1 RES family NAD+ phosphorylase [Rhodococcus fascians]MBY4233220.1 RES family NAD+ phosphorylase [Rhodococcus fascians]
MVAGGNERDSYNGAMPAIDTIKITERLFRISPWSNSYPPNSFNPTHKPLGDLTAGRFDPVEPDHEGFIYVARTVAGAVGEGILRNRVIDQTGFIRRNLLTTLAFTELELTREISVANLTEPHLRRLNLSASLTGCDPDNYDWTRMTASDILKTADAAHGVLYNCRNNSSEEAFLLRKINGLDEKALHIVRSEVILDDPKILDLITNALSTYRIYISEKKKNPFS